MLVTNDITGDSRVKRIADAFSERCHVQLLGVRSNRSPDEEEKGSLNIKRLGERINFQKFSSGNFPFSIFSKVRLFFDNFKISFKQGKVVFDKIKTFDYGEYAKINPEEEKREIKRFKELNFLFLKEGKNFSPDVIYSNDLDTLLAGVILKKRCGSKLIYDSHELFTEQFVNRSKEWKNYFARMEGRLIKEADAVITVNPSIARELSERYGIKELQVIYNCCKLASKIVSARPPFKANGKKIILYHGRFDIRRGLEELIEAFKYVKDAVLVLRGSGPLENYLRKQAADNLKRKVYFLPPVPVEKIIEESAWADAGIITYIPDCLNNFYSTPNKLFEYMMAGLALLASDLPELKRIIAGEELGCVFDPRNPRDIAEKINTLVSDGEALKKAKINSRNAAQKKYNWENESRKLLEICGG